MNIEQWMLDKVRRAFTTQVSAAVLAGDGFGKPMGILDPAAGIPICETAEDTPPGQFRWQDLVALRWQVPVSLQGNGAGGGGARHDEASPRHEAASGHSGFRSHDFLPVSPWVVAATSSVMNARRVTASASRAADRKDSTPPYGRRPLHCGDFDPAKTSKAQHEQMFSGLAPITDCVVLALPSLVARFKLSRLHGPSIFSEMVYICI